MMLTVDYRPSRFEPGRRRVTAPSAGALSSRPARTVSNQPYTSRRRVSANLTPPPLSRAVTATSERAQVSIVAVAITLALVLLAVVAGFLLSGR